MKKLTIGILISGTGTNMININGSCKSGAINGNVVCVGSDNPNAFGLEYAEKDRIPTFLLDFKKAKKDYENDDEHDVDSITEEVTRKALQFLPEIAPLGQQSIKQIAIRMNVEKYLLAELKKYKVDLLVLAGYMRLLTPFFLNEFQPDEFHPRVMNIHPALLPAFPGNEGYEPAFNYGVEEYGPTVHFVDFGEDTGPIIGQTAIKREGNYNDLGKFKARGLEAEYSLYTKCIQLFAERRLKVELGPDGKRKVVTTLPAKRFDPR